VQNIHPYPYQCKLVEQQSYQLARSGGKIGGLINPKKNGATWLSKYFFSSAARLLGLQINQLELLEISTWHQ